MDKKEYRQIIINKNGLRVILASDTLAMVHQQHDGYYSESDDDDVNDSNKQHEERKERESDDEDSEDEESFEDDGLRTAAAAVIVGAGSFHDPPFVQGMAHFLEHMLFMGNKKYPGENDFDVFLGKNSGDDNAYTELEHTMYHMEVCQEKFAEALDRFGHFFVSPLLLEDAVERELNAIESEFQLSKNSDDCRLGQLLCHDCGLQWQSKRDQSKKHPFASFSWGNTESLKHIPERNGIDMMKELRKFYNRHYYAHNMSVVVIGAYSLDELEKFVVESFSEVPAFSVIDLDENGESDPYCDSMAIKYSNVGTWEATAHTPIEDFKMPFRSETLGRITRIVPVKDKHGLSITWQIPPQWKNWKSKPCDYIAHLLGHEAKGSILSFLKEKSWVNGCYAGVGEGGYEHASSHALFCLELTLSVDGVSHWSKIVEIVYIYIGMIRYYCKTEGLPEWIYEELRAIQQVSHEFEDEAAPMDWVQDVADCLAPYKCIPPQRLLDGDALLFEYDADSIEVSVQRTLY